RGSRRAARRDVRSARDDRRARSPPPAEGRGYHGPRSGREELMARAMRPVVVLMLLATVLFVADGVLDHAYLNQPIFDEYKGGGWTSFVFAIANLLMTIAVARGSERTLLGRIALSAFFIVERPLTAFVLGPKPVTSIAVPFVTAVVELVILTRALSL